MRDQFDSPLRSSLIKFASEARALYRETPEMSCATERSRAPEVFIVDKDEKRLHMIVSSPNDPRALELLPGCIQRVRSAQDLVVITDPEAQERAPQTIPGIFAKWASENGLRVENPFVTYADPSILEKVVVHKDAVKRGLSHENIMGALITNNAIMSHSSSSRDLLEGSSTLIKAWKDRFPVDEILHGAQEMALFPRMKAFYEAISASISSCSKSAKQLGIESSPKNPDFIDFLIQDLSSKAPFVERKHVFGYAVNALSRPVQDGQLPDYLGSILIASGTWSPQLGLREIHDAVVDWLIEHHEAGFGHMVEENKAIIDICQRVENQESRRAFVGLFHSCSERNLVGWCTSRDIGELQDLFTE